MNPTVEGWYADPEARYYRSRYWVYVTQSFSEYTRQLNIDVFSSADGILWEKHKNIIEMSGFPWIWRAVWAPTVIEKNNGYYLVFASNDIQSDREKGGLEIAYAENPEGPFKALTGQPLIDSFVHGAQPIDTHLFKDDNGDIFLFYGGWGHCNFARMDDNMTGFIPLDNGELFREITPED